MSGTGGDRTRPNSDLGLGGDETLAGEETSAPPTEPEPATVLGQERYEDAGLLGRGGMGEVRLCRDTRIGRRVALKMLRQHRADQPRARARFLREVTVQGQLQHPAIVPVYDLEETKDSRLFFTMKRVEGRTLQEIIQELRDDPSSHARRRLLTAFSQVCRGIAYAHGRGIVHRDLKPANIMFGEFGEVYVLDWGLAKLLDGEELDEADGPPSGDHLADGETVDGEILGTPGYMAPEQLDARRKYIDARADVYALGSMLFEMLTAQALHETGSPRRAIASTLTGADARAHVRAPDRDVPPELEELCVRATATDPRDRVDDCAALAEAIESYLDGDRDLALRRQIADECADEATKSADVALQTDDPGHEARGTALALVSRSLALDPEHEAARATLMRLLTTPPSVLPPEALEAMAENEREAGRSAAKMGIVAFSGMLGFLPLVFAMGVGDYTWLTLVCTALAGAVVASVFGARHPDPQIWAAPTAVVFCAISIALMSRIFGPLVMLPGVAAAAAAAFGMHVSGRRRAYYIAMFVVAIVGPLALESVGVLQPSYTFTDHGFLVVPQMTEFPEALTLTFLVTASVATVLVTAVLISRTSDDRRKAQERLAVHAWHLDMLVPKSSRGEAKPRPQEARRAAS